MAAKPWIRRVREGLGLGLNRLRYRGDVRYCPICGGHASKFLAFGVVPRPEARCPFCGALERHRLIWLFFVRKTDLFKLPRKRMLHVAPEMAFESKLASAININYLSADFEGGRAMVRMDITDIHYPEDSFDVIYCSHVLEHVHDDRMAMRELRRVLKPAGWAVLQVPITVSRTFEDPSITDPAERERIFGQWDHVRNYGPDYQNRLEEAGFVVKRYAVSEIATESEQDAMQIRGQPDVFLCRKGVVGGNTRHAQ